MRHGNFFYVPLADIPLQFLLETVELGPHIDCFLLVDGVRTILLYPCVKVWHIDIET